MSAFAYLKVFTGRRFPFSYISPAVCEGEFSSSGTPFISLLPILRANGPTGLLMEAVSGHFHFSWDVVQGALCYSVYKAVDDLDPYGAYTLIAECITDTSIDLDDAGTYKVVPITRDGTGEDSTPIVTPIVGGGGGGNFIFWETFADSDPHTDSIALLPLVYGSGTPATSSPGKIGSGWRFNLAPNEASVYDTGYHAALTETGNGFTMYLWMNLKNLSGFGEFQVAYNLKDVDGNVVTGIAFQYIPGEFTVIGPGGAANILLSVHDMGFDTDQFIAVAFDPVLQKSKISLNGGDPVVTDFTGDVSIVPVSGAVVVTAAAAGISALLDVVLDEIAIAVGPQSQADVLAIYNSGAGKTWPL